MTKSGSNSVGRLKGYVERVEALDQEIAALNSDKSDVFKEAKSVGYDPNAIRNALKFRRDPGAYIERNQATMLVLRELGHDVAPMAEVPGAEDVGTSVATRARTSSDAEGGAE